MTVQNLTFVDGNSRGEDPDGGGAIFVRGGRFKVINSRFFHNVCDDVYPGIFVLASGDPQVVNSTIE